MTPPIDRWLVGALRRHGRRRWSGVFVLAAIVGAAMPAAAELPAAADLITRMREAAAGLNYDGVVLYQRGMNVLTMRIIHRGVPAPESERIVTLDGPPREIVRDGRHVTCVFADDRSVMVDKRGPRNPLAFGVDLDSGTLAAHYEFRTYGEERVAGRAAFAVAIQPKDPARYGYRLWVDADNGMLLKSAVVAADGRLLEQTRFTTVDFPERIPDELLEPQFTDQQFAWFSYETASPAAERDGPEDRATLREAWAVNWLPAGFEMTEEAEEQFIDHDYRVSHRVYTDGLAMVSVFVEPGGGAGSRDLGFGSVGAINTFSRLSDGYKVTVVGELPRTTISRIAASVEASR